MIFGEKEIHLIENLQLFYKEGLQRIALFPSLTVELKNIVNVVCDQEEWKKWIDSSGKSAPPPDFYSDEYRLMMDVMRVNDHEQKGKKGKLHNPSLAHEKEMYKELLDKGIVDRFSRAKVFLNGDTKLPTFEDHNYDQYFKCFRRVIAKHIESIPIYKSNHEGYKVIFFVFDESSAYFEMREPVDTKKEFSVGDLVAGRPHEFYLDNAFLDAFVDKGIDYLFWYTPYKMFEHISPLVEFPTLCVYDLSKKQKQGITFDTSKMISVEV